MRNGFYHWAKLDVAPFHSFNYTAKALLDDFRVPAQSAIMAKLQVKYPAVNEKRLSLIKNSFPIKWSPCW